METKPPAAILRRRVMQHMLLICKMPVVGKMKPWSGEVIKRKNLQYGWVRFFAMETCQNVRMHVRLAKQNRPRARDPVYYKKSLSCREIIYFSFASVPQFFYATTLRCWLLYTWWTIFAQVTTSKLLLLTLDDGLGVLFHHVTAAYTGSSICVPHVQDTVDGIPVAGLYVGHVRGIVMHGIRYMGTSYTGSHLYMHCHNFVL